MHIGKYLNVKSKFLSGGNKRKLSVCLSVIGKNDVIFFDGKNNFFLILLIEPTTGIDPYSRRLVWTLLKKSIASC